MHAERAAARDDRFVRRGRLRVGARGSPSLARFALEEALRLARLPGEDHGRVYFFRRVALHGMPDARERTAWQRALQHALERTAAYAVHGDDVRAEQAAAVWFDSRSAALTSLLRRTLARQSRSAWYWPLVGGARASAHALPDVAAVVDALCAEDGGWLRAADAVLAAVHHDGAAPLVRAVPPAAVARWLRALGDDGAHAATAALPGDLRTVLTNALDVLHADDPRVVWLATLAIVLVVPTSLDDCTAVARARATLRTIARARDAAVEGAAPRATADDALRAANEASRAADERTPPLAAMRAAASDDANGAERERAPQAAPHGAAARRAADARDAGSAAVPDGDAATRATRSAAGAHAPARVRYDAERDGEPALPDAARREAAARAGAPVNAAAGADVAFAPPDTGPTTSAGGLFFLLNPMARLGIAAELRANAALAEGGLAARVLRLLAHDAGVPADDPVYAVLDELAPPLADEADPIAGTVAAMWARAVRAWCARRARIPARRVVCRRARIAATRTDVDVTLRLDAVDLRTRRAALDVDPGWLPWLGRVVRFHYSDDEAPC